MRVIWLCIGMEKDVDFFLVCYLLCPNKKENPNS